jgi:monoamine oxidase
VTSHYYFHSTRDQAGKQGILCSYAIGEKADVLAAQSDARRLEIITRDLLPFNERAPRLARHIQSMPWQRDRYTGGAYAVYRPGQWFTVRPALQKSQANTSQTGRASWKALSSRAKRRRRLSTARQGLDAVHKLR